MKELIYKQIIAKYEKLVNLLYLEFLDEKSVAKASKSDILGKLDVEIMELQEKLKEEEDNLKCNDSCKWFRVGYGHCVWCIRNSPYGRKDKSYKVNFDVIKSEINYKNKQNGN